MDDLMKKKIFTGVSFISISFLCIVALFYLMVRSERESTKEIVALQNKVMALTSENQIAKKQAAELKDQVGQTLSFDKIIRKSEAIHGDAEKKKEEGDLWVDHKNNQWVITLGALNGVEAGQKLKVFEGDNFVGFVYVDFVSDVISYVYPESNSLNKFPDDYYRVVLE